jgi:hypothetical protein
MMSLQAREQPVGRVAKLDPMRAVGFLLARDELVLA